MLSARTYWSGPLAALLAWWPGAARSWDRSDSRRREVRGQVLESGRPVGGGWIEFVPI